MCCAVNPTMPCLAFRRHRKCEAIEFLQAENGLPVVVAEPVVAESVVAETGVADQSADGTASLPAISS